MEKNLLNTEMFNCEKCDFKCCKQSEWNRHIMRPKHIKLETNMKKIQKTPKYTRVLNVTLYVANKVSGTDIL